MQGITIQSMIKIHLSKTTQRVALILLSWIILCCLPHANAREGWQVVRDGKNFGISGITLFEQKKSRIRLLAVHDNKMPGQGRIAIITMESGAAPEYMPLIWLDTTELPVDMESVTSVPGGDASTFMTLTSKGKIYHLKINSHDLNTSILKVFSLPGTGRGQNFEGIALHRIDKRLLAVWAHRGKNNEPAVIYWGWLNLSSYSLSVIGSAKLKVPWPTQADIRHITDIKITPRGIAVITSASDPGDNGPFQSAAYIAGLFRSSGDSVKFNSATKLVPFCRFDNHKVEALELVNGKSGSIVFATDDENFGSSIRFFGPSELQKLHVLLRNEKMMKEAKPWMR